MSATDEPAGHESPFEPEIYEQLRALAHHVMRGERAGHTLAPTALVHEVWLRLADGPGSGYRDAAHFKSVAAKAMRHVLVDHARARTAQKRGGGATHVTLEDSVDAGFDRTEDILHVDLLLNRLREHDPQLEQLVVMRFFAGMTEIEIAQVMGCSDRWVRQQWTFARAWLRRALEGDAIA